MHLLSGGHRMNFLHSIIIWHLKIRPWMQEAKCEILGAPYLWRTQIPMDDPDFRFHRRYKFERIHSGRLPFPRPLLNER